jgi:ribosome-binding protein aMBF1 (putative translation factor)
MNKHEDIIGYLQSKITPESQEESNYRMGLAAKIYHAMRAKGWSQKKFAEEMGKKDSVISRWLSGCHNFEADTLFAIQKKLGINLLDLEHDSPDDDDASEEQKPIRKKNKKASGV